MMGSQNLEDLGKRVAFFGKMSKVEFIVMYRGLELIDGYVNKGNVLVEIRGSKVTITTGLETYRFTLKDKVLLDPAVAVSIIDNSFNAWLALVEHLDVTEKEYIEITQKILENYGARTPEDVFHDLQERIKEELEEEVAEAEAQ
jgi:hypothetical protein